MSHSIAIVGSGPAGFYAAEALCKKGPEGLRVDILDKLPTPYGLVRSGVAPDHQGTKNVWRVFDRTARREQVRFLGNVEVGRDVSVDELRARYDAVVLASGVTVDRRLGIPGEDLPGVYGSRAITAWYNGHPDYADLDPDLEGPGVLVVGNGNVAVDVVRVFARDREEMATTDLPEYAMAKLEAAGFEELTMLGRRGPMDASFTPVELRELGDMTGTVALVDGAQLPETVTADDPKQQKLKEKILKTLGGYAENDRAAKGRRLHIRFFGSPVRFHGTDRVAAVEVGINRIEGGRAKATGETYMLEARTVVTCIGYDAAPIVGVPTHEWGNKYANEDGRVAQGLYAVGWAKRGPSGVIATNRKDSIATVDLLLSELGEATADGGPEAFDALVAERGLEVVSFAGWDRIDEAEKAAAAEGQVRQKITDRSALLAAARE
jgi:NADPH-dependent glutamate synthase beta subunit-like oxidoreductase